MKCSGQVPGPHRAHLVVTQFWGYFTVGENPTKFTCIMESDNQWQNSEHEEGTEILEQKNCQVLYAQ